MEFQLADLFEAVAAAVPDREALVTRSIGTEHAATADGTEPRVRGASDEQVRWTYAELAERIERMAVLLADHGVKPGDRVGLLLHNGWPYIVAMMASFALRAIPVNVNYRYTASELAYVFADAGLTVVVSDPDLASGAIEARETWAREVGAREVGAHEVGAHEVGAHEVGASNPGDTGSAGDSAGDMEVIVADGALASVLSQRDGRWPGIRPVKRSPDDLYLLYTGGTTGSPKGVMWRQEDIYFASLGGRGTPSAGIAAVSRPEELVDRVRRGDPLLRRLPLCPLMHGGAMWVALQTLLGGGCLVLSVDRRFDPDAALFLLQEEQVQLTMVIGDATARPLAAALNKSPSTYDLSSLQVIASGGAVLAPDTVRDLQVRLPHVKIVDTFGASETGGQGRLQRGRDGGPPRLLTDGDTAVFDDLDRRVEPGSGVVGRLARGGRIPIGYWGDAEKSAATFLTIEGRRWSVPGDMATIESDGSITLYGRDSACINTGGEKVFAEEVEGVIKSHGAVGDALVVGLPDQRFGQRVVAVVAFRPVPSGGFPPTDAELDALVRRQLAGYKVPRTWIRVDTCRRLPTGKPDYRWAASVALWGGVPESRRLPLASRLAPTSNRYERAMRAHDAAVACGDTGYFDPTSGLFVMTAVTLWTKGHCCTSGCRHCPFERR